MCWWGDLFGESQDTGNAAPPGADSGSDFQAASTPNVNDSYAAYLAQTQALTDEGNGSFTPPAAAPYSGLVPLTQGDSTETDISSPGQNTETEAEQTAPTVLPAYYASPDNSTPVTASQDLTQETQQTSENPPLETGAESAGSAAAQAPIVLPAYVVTDTPLQPAAASPDETQQSDENPPDNTGGQSGGSGGSEGPIVLPPFVVTDTPIPPVTVPLPDVQPPDVLPPPPVLVQIPPFTTPPVQSPAFNPPVSKPIKIKPTPNPKANIPFVPQKIVIPKLTTPAKTTPTGSTSKTPVNSSALSRIVSRPIVSNPINPVSTGSGSSLLILGLIAAGLYLASRDSEKN